MKKNKEVVKTYFETGDKPTQEQYANLIDSYLDAKQPEGDANRRFNIDANGEVSLVTETDGASDFTKPEVEKLKTFLKRNTGLVINNFVDRDEIPPFPWEDGASLVTFKNYDHGSSQANYMLVSESTITNDLNRDYLKHYKKVAILFYSKVHQLPLSFLMEIDNGISVDGFITFKVNEVLGTDFHSFAPEEEGRFTKNCYVIPVLPKEGAGGGETDLSFKGSLGQGTIESSTGKNAVIPVADKDRAGLMKADFYEERTFEPKLYAREGNQNEYTAVLASGKAVRLGNLVQFSLNIKNISDPSDISGEGIYITGFPFPNDSVGGTYASSDSIINFRATSLGAGVEIGDLTTFLLIDRILIINKKNAERVSNVSFNGGVSSNDITISGSYITNIFAP